MLSELWIRCNILQNRRPQDRAGDSLLFESFFGLLQEAEAKGRRGSQDQQKCSDPPKHEIEGHNTHFGRSVTGNEYCVPLLRGAGR